MRPDGSVIVTCAVTGSAHTPTMNTDMPVTVDEMVEQSVAAADAGAAVIHLHARDPRDGRPSADPGLSGSTAPASRRAATRSCR